MTIRDVAKQAGVSIATVSRVMNGSDKVSDTVKQQVEMAIEALNYQKPAPKKKKATKLFAVIVRNLSNPFFTQLLDVLEEEAFKHGRSILLFNSRNNLQLEKLFLKECENHHVDGVFLVPRSIKEQHIQSLHELPFPVVLLTVTTPTMLSVGTNHHRGGELVAQHFLQHGHRRIGYLGASDLRSDRFIGFQTTLAQNGILLDSDHILTGYDESALDRYISQHIIDNSDKSLTAIFCSDDIAASQLHTQLQAQLQTLLQTQSKAHAPQNTRSRPVTIMGFDDTYLARTLGFSSVHQPMRDIALQGFELMLRQLREPTTTAHPDNPTCNRAISLAPNLVIRHAPHQGITVRQAEILKE